MMWYESHPWTDYIPDSGQELNKRQLLNLLQMRRLEDLVSKASLADQERLMVELSSCKKMVCFPSNTQE